ncbi:MAG: hypothetical protein R3D27_00305 [Hyphomicrobiaceae bacterium]
MRLLLAAVALSGLVSIAAHHAPAIGAMLGTGAAPSAGPQGGMR